MSKQHLKPLTDSKYQQLAAIGSNLETLWDDSGRLGRLELIMGSTWQQIAANNRKQEQTATENSN